VLCRKVEEFLAGRGIAFQTRNVAEDPAAMDALMRPGMATTPVTVIDGEIVIGFDQKRLAALLGFQERK
jgi:glutaredoxin